MKRLLSLFCVIAMLFLSVAVVCAQSEEEATELSRQVTVTDLSSDEWNKFTDHSYQTYISFSEQRSFTITSEEPIAALYLVFDRNPAEWILKNGETSVKCGDNHFLHEFVDVKEAFGSAQKTLAIAFPAGISLADVYVYTDGQLPQTVQQWRPAEGSCDLLLFATHSDDDQLFFAGLLPTYNSRGMEVQVAYFVHHLSTHDRPHELLNGLWHTGLTRYPVISDFPDAYSESSWEAEQNLAASGFDREAVLIWQTDLLRRFRPLVAVGHDLEGEYGHGQHRYNAETLTDAIALANDPNFDTPSLSEKGVWDTPRLYLHLYQDNAVVCDYDTPLDAFDGKTAFEVSKEAFEYHKSQHWTWFYDWINVSSAKDIRQYSPCRFGLYYAADGSYPTGGDFFEGLETYAERAARLEAEMKAELEAQKAETETQLEKSEAELEGLNQEISEIRSNYENVTLWLIVLSSVFLFLVFLLVVMTVFRKHKRNASIKKEG